MWTEAKEKVNERGFLIEYMIKVWINCEYIITYERLLK